MNPEQITSELRGLKPPIEIPEAASGYSPVVFLAVAFLLVVLAVFGWWFYRRAKVDVEGDPVAESLKELDTVGAILTEADSETYAMGVSNVLRRYLERHVGVFAVRQTTDEFLSVVAGAEDRLTPQQRGDLREFLSQCDMVKFARGELAVEHRQALHGCARNFIETTAKSLSIEAAPDQGTESNNALSSAA